MLIPKWDVHTSLFNSQGASLEDGGERVLDPEGGDKYCETESAEYTMAAAHKNSSRQWLLA